MALYKLAETFLKNIVPNDDNIETSEKPVEKKRFALNFLWGNKDEAPEEIIQPKANIETNIAAEKFPLNQEWKDPNIYGDVLGKQDIDLTMGLEGDFKDNTGNGFQKFESRGDGKKTSAYGLTLDDPVVNKLIKPEEIFTGLSKERARQIAVERYKVAQLETEKFIPNIKEQPKPVQDALVDLNYNLGFPKLSGFENFQQAIIDKDYARAADELEWHDGVKKDYKTKYYNDTKRRALYHINTLRDLAKQIPPNPDRVLPEEKNELLTLMKKQIPRVSESFQPFVRAVVPGMLERDIQDKENLVKDLSKAVRTGFGAMAASFGSGSFVFYIISMASKWGLDFIPNLSATKLGKRIIKETGGKVPMAGLGIGNKQVEVPTKTAMDILQEVVKFYASMKAGNLAATKWIQYGHKIEPEYAVKAIKNLLMRDAGKHMKFPAIKGMPRNILMTEEQAQEMAEQVWKIYNANGARGLPKEVAGEMMSQLYKDIVNKALRSIGVGNKSGFAKFIGKIPKEIIEKYKLTPEDIKQIGKGILTGLPTAVVDALSKLTTLNPQDYASAEEFVKAQGKTNKTPKELTNIWKNSNRKILVDSENSELLSKYSFSYKGKNPYPRGRVGDKVVYLHDLVLGIKDKKGLVVDHINGNPLDNRKENLQLISQQSNVFKMKTPKTNTSGTKGVKFNKFINKWVASIAPNGKTIHLGSFDSIEDATKARIEGEKKYIEPIQDYNKAQKGTETPQISTETHIGDEITGNTSNVPLKKESGLETKYRLNMPKAGGNIPQKITPQEQKALDKINPKDMKGVTLRKDLSIKDSFGNTKNYKAGEDIYIYQDPSTGKAIVKDGDYGILPKKAVEQVEQAGSKWGGLQKEEGVSEVVKGGGEKTYSEDDISEDPLNDIMSKEFGLDITYENGLVGFMPDGGGIVRSNDITNPRAKKIAEQLEKKYDSKETPTKFSQYQLPGGENYEETLWKLPEKEIPSGKFDATKFALKVHNKEISDTEARKTLSDVGLGDSQISEALGYLRSSSGHDRTLGMNFIRSVGQTQYGKKFDEVTFKSHAFPEESNNYGWMRTNWRTTPDGKKVLFLEEVQHVNPRNDRITQEQYDALPDYAKGNKFYEDSLKKALEKAVKGKADYIAWTTGEQQADRYDLSKHIDKLEYYNDNELVGYDKQGNTVLKKDDVPPEDLEKYVGKDVAPKLLRQHAWETLPKVFVKTISGQDLKIGGEWAKNLYDKQIPNILKKLTKGEVGEVKIPTTDMVNSITGKTPTNWQTTQQSLKITPQIRRQVIGQPMGGGNIQTPESEKTPERTPVQNVIDALKKAKPIRGKQEQLYSEERKKRLARAMAMGQKVKGEQGLYAQLGQLKGSITKVQFDSLRQDLKQEDIDSLFQLIEDNPNIRGFQKINSKVALAKLFGEFGGTIPTKGEIKLLKKIFPEELINAIEESRPMLDKFKDAGLQIVNLPRSLMASYDLSAPLRQGAFFLGRPKQFFPAFKKMFQVVGSQKAFDALQAEIQSRPNFELMNEAGLSMTDIDSDMTNREEAFMSQWAEKIPIIGGGVKASERAYIGFLNKLRADVFDDLVNKATNIGRDPRENMDLAKGIAKLVNVGTGRGSLGTLERIGPLLNSVFFSPKLMASRLTLMNPMYYAKADPFVRKEALKSLFSFIGIGLTVIGLAKAMGSAIGTDPRSSDFGKIRIRNTRIDVWAGFQQYARMLGQLISGQYVSSTTGKVLTLGEGYKPLTRLDILQRQLESKLAPISSFVVTLLKGQTFMGDKINIPKEIGLRLTPMVIQDVYDLATQDPKLLPVAGLGALGVGTMTYTPREKKSTKEVYGKKKYTLNTKTYGKKTYGKKKYN